MSKTPLEPESPLWEDATPRPRTPWVTYGVLVVCVAVWAGIWYSGDPDSEEVLYRHGYADAWEIWDGAWWSLITSAFVHVDLIHVFFNMYWLWILGRVLERSIGPARSLGLIVLTAFVSSAAPLSISEDTGLGFSGVGYAVFGFMWLARPRYPSFAVAVDSWVVLVFLGWLVWGFAGGLGDIGNIAHLCGLLCGGLLAHATSRTPKRTPAIAAITLLTLASFVPLFWMPWSPWWTTYKGVQAHYDEENLEEAITWYRKALELGPY
ncbi:MAG: rhomboid family intramembrane serine protease, partial [Planctomycetota bacterium]|nr:rhomboid family intramembrane serine protease [Planctomycetota bacterium]